MEASVADEFYSGEGFWHFFPCNILYIAPENLSCSPRKASNTPRKYTAVIVSNYGMPMPCIICMPTVEQNYESRAE